ncbi:hypothetical protein H0194_07400 [Corynebacterium incognita]|uniref:DUF2273 domain-containing protein n=1 Tax=Corynebacterium incognita TaxID=2754725 RepID=A0A7G7CMT6_9CORY|nr:hypothetical protein [Corynebacterium incognita]QNE88902.1 hypothetical protein H0194_07400 [Corynebacterium incognita]
MFNYTILGVLIGLAVAIAIMLGSPAIILALVLATVGGLIGAHFDGRVNLMELWNNFIGKGKA